MLSNQSKSALSSRVRLHALVVLALLALVGLATSVAKPDSVSNAASAPATSPSSQENTAASKPVVIYPVRSDTSAPLGSIKPRLTLQRPFRELNQENTLPRSSPQGVVKDPVVQTFFGPLAMPAPVVSFEGMNAPNGYAPPDTNGDVGPNHYVQTVNASFQIWNKSGTSLYGPADMKVLWSGFGGVCESTNFGDPIVLYDQLANRW